MVLSPRPECTGLRERSTKEHPMRNTLSWFELFVSDMPRAKAFYEQLLATQLKAEQFNGEPNAIFAAEGLKGALVKREGRKPSPEGALVYLDCTGTLDAVLGRVAKAGGKVVVPKTDIGDPGFIAVIADTEGNAVGLHSQRR
jgi:predicted enzyme related to lactoylglutathione lyase